MELKFDLEEKDVAAQIGYMYDHSPVIKRSVFLSKILRCLIIYAVLYLIWLSAGKLYAMQFLSVGVIMPFTIYLVAKYFWKESYITRSMKFMQKEDRKFLGERSVQITGEGVILKTPYHETKFAWASLGEIVSEGDHTFIFIGTTNAIVIPHKNVSKEEYVAFMSDLKDRYVPDQKLLENS